MAHILKIANSESVSLRPKPFVLTETARDILRTAELVRSANRQMMTMVAGAPGTGKTLALQRFCSDEGFDAEFLSIAAGEGTPNAVAENMLLKHGRKANGKSLPSRREELFGCIRYCRVLVIDDAHHLDETGLEWVRALAEDSRCDLILSGSLELANKVGGIPQLRSRLFRPVIVKQVSHADVEALTEGTVFAAPEVVDALYGVARYYGGLRKVRDVIDLALDGAGHDAPGHMHIKAAMAEMKLVPEGNV